MAAVFIVLEHEYGRCDVSVRHGKKRKRNKSLNRAKPRKIENAPLCHP